MARSLARAIAGAALLSLIAQPVLAHAELIGATPGPDEVVVGSSAELVARFNQDLDPSRTSLEVRDAGGTRVARGGALGAGPREFRLALPSLSPGVYEVRWTSFSAEDGELARGSYSFTVAEAPSPSPTPTPSTTPTTTPTLTSSPSRSASALPSATGAASTVPGSGAPDATAPGSGGGDGSILVPIVVALVAVGAIGVWLARRRAA